MPGFRLVPRIAQLGVEGRQRLRARRRSDAARGPRPAARAGTPPRPPPAPACGRCGCRGRRRAGRGYVSTTASVQASPSRAGRPERRRADLEGEGEVGDILPRDGISVGGQRHRLPQRDRRRGRDVLRSALAEPARAGAPDRGVDLARRRPPWSRPAPAPAARAAVRPSRSAARASGASRSTMPRLVLRPGPAPGGLDRGADRRAERVRAGLGHAGTDRHGARQEILVAGVVEVQSRARRSPAWARSPRAGRRAAPAAATSAGVVTRRPRRAGRPAAPATSTPVASWSPRQPGMPFTSSTYTVPSRAGSRSTPAYSAPTAAAARTASAAPLLGARSHGAAPPAAGQSWCASRRRAARWRRSPAPPRTNARTSRPS